MQREDFMHSVDLTSRFDIYERRFPHDLVLLDEYTYTRYFGAGCAG